MPLLFLTFEEENTRFVTLNLSPVPSSDLNGFFAFAAYEFQNELFYVLQPLNDYQTNHSGIHSNMCVLKKMQRLAFFANSSSKFPLCKFLETEPKFGGELLLLESQIIFWNFKSRCYSLKKNDYRDDSPLLKESIKLSLLPPERFITAGAADQFAQEELQKYFNENGKFIQKETRESTVSLIQASLGLSCSPPPQPAKKALFK